MSAIATSRGTKSCEKVFERPPRFLCLNDDDLAEGDSEASRVHREFLGKLFPQPSSFEMPPAR